MNLVIWRRDVVAMGSALCHGLIALADRRFRTERTIYRVITGSEAVKSYEKEWENEITCYMGWYGKRIWHVGCHTGTSGQWGFAVMAVYISHAVIFLFIRILFQWRLYVGTGMHLMRVKDMRHIWLLLYWCKRECGRYGFWHVYSFWTYCFSLQWNA